MALVLTASGALLGLLPDRRRFSSGRRWACGLTVTALVVLAASSLGHAVLSHGAASPEPLGGAGWLREHRLPPVLVSVQLLMVWLLRRE